MGDATGVRRGQGRSQVAGRRAPPAEPPPPRRAPDGRVAAGGGGSEEAGALGTAGRGRAGGQTLGHRSYRMRFGLPYARAHSLRQNICMKCVVTTCQEGGRGGGCWPAPTDAVSQP